ncbi:MAG: hypothetical protein ABIV11_01375, partial [Gemmatimonadaceae bacterium]
MIHARHASRISFARKHYGRVAELVLRLKFALLLPVKMGVRTAQMLIPARRDESAQRLNGYWKAF